MNSVGHCRRKVGISKGEVDVDQVGACFRQGDRKVVCKILASELQHDIGRGRVRGQIAVISSVEFRELQVEEKSDANIDNI